MDLAGVRAVFVVDVEVVAHFCSFFLAIWVVWVVWVVMEGGGWRARVGGLCAS